MDDSAQASPGDVTRLLIAWREGDPAAPGDLFTLVYDQLRALARFQVRRGGPEQSLGATGLVHEVYLKLVDHPRLDVRDRGHFFALAARAMRQVLVDRARRRSAGKRGGSPPPETLVDEAPAVDARTEELLALDEALSRLENLDPRLVRLVEVRFFAGLSVEEAAEALEMSTRTVKRDWQKARAVLHRELTAAAAPEGAP
jgi:RNA polymerase sigma factor (TIGR02999 family)